MINLIQLGTQLHNIPASAKRGILKALVMVGSAQDDQAFRDEYWNQVPAALWSRSRLFGTFLPELEPEKNTAPAPYMT